MSEVSQATFTCESCGKSYRWKAELAGKKVKCKCGAVMEVSSEPPEEDGLYGLAAGDEPPLQKPTRAAPVAAPVEEDSGYRCPNCSSSMQPGTVACLACGFNLKTGKKGPASSTAPTRATRAPATSGAAAAARAAPTASRPKQMETDNSGMIKLVASLGVIVVLIASVFIIRMVWNRPDPALADAKGDDALVLRMMDEEGATELIKWLDENPQRHMVAGWTESQARGYAKRFYEEMGAKEVLAFGGGMTLSLAIELPDDLAKRAMLFNWELRFGRPDGEPVKDEGQKYLLVRMHL